MAGIKISNLPAIVTPAATDLFATVQSGTTYKVTGTQMGTLFVPISGGTMTGALILNTNSPTTALQAASKGYVDSIAQGITIQGACRLGSTGALTVTYANGVSGVGATLTNAGAMVALTLDGVAAVAGDRVLIKNQASTLQNGIYTVTNIGSGATNWVLTRATDYDQPSEINPGDLVIITAGITLTNSSWIETATVATIGTDPITFSQFSASLPITVPNGGTGLTSTTINQILWSPSANTIAGLATAASGFLITSAGGVPSISSTVPAHTVSGNITFSPTTAGIVGTTTNDDAAAGNIGEFISSNILIGASVAVVDNVSKSITSIVLTPGDWDVGGMLITNPAAGTTTSAYRSYISLVDNTPPTIGPNASAVGIDNIPASANQVWSIPTGMCRISVAAPTTVYIVARIDFAVSTMGVYGYILARRAR